jgi:hypothetical protein
MPFHKSYIHKMLGDWASQAALEPRADVVKLLLPLHVIVNFVTARLQGKKLRWLRDLARIPGRK